MAGVEQIEGPEGNTLFAHRLSSIAVVASVLVRVDLGYGGQPAGQPEPDESMIHRKAVRALLVRDSDDRVLLMKARLPDRNVDLWLTPGGGTEMGETPDESLFREVREETGLEIDGHHGLVWRRRHQFTFRGRRYDQREDFYLVRTPPFEPTHLQNPALHEQETFDRFHWWSVAEIERSDETFVPRRFAAHLADLLRGGVPDEPVIVGA
jgi:8-oxo-dGTP pyrophosphatase MutT (NUDIX family)